MHSIQLTIKTLNLNYMYQIFSDYFRQIRDISSKYLVTTHFTVDILYHSSYHILFDRIFNIDTGSLKNQGNTSLVYKVLRSKHESVPIKSQNTLNTGP
jgi:hypothetical protein